MWYGYSSLENKILILFYAIDQLLCMTKSPFSLNEKNNNKSSWIGNVQPPYMIEKSKTSYAINSYQIITVKKLNSINETAVKWLQWEHFNGREKHTMSILVDSQSGRKVQVDHFTRKNVNVREVQYLDCARAHHCIQKKNCNV